VADPYSAVGLGIPEPSAHAVGPWATRRDFRVAGLVFAALVVIGVLLGLIWPGITPRAQGFVYLKHTIVPLETESFVASDGRFVLLTAPVGIVAGLGAWLHRASRGPVMAAALATGGLLGALLTEVVGRATGGGKTSGALGDGLTLPVTLHARGLLLVEPVLALFVYSVGALCAKRDDLGRPGDPEPDGAWLPAPSCH
jgi:hypothetical protein